MLACFISWFGATDQLDFFWSQSTFAVETWYHCDSAVSEGKEEQLIGKLALGLQKWYGFCEPDIEKIPEHLVQKYLDRRDVRKPANIPDMLKVLQFKKN